MHKGAEEKGCDLQQNTDILYIQYAYAYAYVFVELFISLGIVSKLNTNTNTSMASIIMYNVHSCAPMHGIPFIFRFYGI